jgi:hypothetical protein
VDKQALAMLIPIAALAIPTVAIIMNGMLKLARLRLEEAKARAGAIGEGSVDLAALRDEVTDLRHELAEVHERLDFTERMLTQQREAKELPGG